MITRVTNLFFRLNKLKNQLRNKKSIIAFIVLLILAVTRVSAANESRSDTIDILHYDIHLTVNDFIHNTINGYCHIHFKSKMDNINFINLDLYKLNVDSVIQNGVHINYTQDTLLLKITLPDTLNTNDSTDITIYYGGVPQKDPKFGGFYFSGNYAYNIGACFVDLPHSFGRCWHPCFDNFVEKATYDTYFTVSTANTASGNGLLQSDSDNLDGTHTLHWHLAERIPAYIECISVNSYSIVRNTFYIGSQPVPVEFYVMAADSSQMKASFIHLQDIFNIFNKLYGPYRWEKVGYEEVPFNAGAMEHATMIAYPVFGITGDLTWEGPIIAHELSHHWFGDLVTCQTAQDMWLHEGWAEYSYRLFFENYYGEAKFLSSYQSNHLNALQLAHAIDGNNFFPVSGVPDNYTYGRTTYWKGADVAHSLRAYMGDSLFFSSLKTYFKSLAFQNTNSSIFRDSLSKYSGIDLTDFFKDWVFNPGWASFMVDSFAVSPIQGPPEIFVDVFMRQKLDHSLHYYNNVPVELTFMDANMDTVIRKVSMSGYCQRFTVGLPFIPVFVGVNTRNKISEAVSADNLMIKKKGSVAVDYGMLTSFNVNAITDSVFLRVEQVFSPPDPITPPITNLHISSYRYWKIDGVIPGTFDASAFFPYNGTKNQGSGYLDNDLLAGGSEDSLVLLYRPGIFYSWTVLKDTDIVNYFGGDSLGYIKVKHIKKGEYALAIYNGSKTDSIVPTISECEFYNSIPAIKTQDMYLELRPSITTNETNISGIAIGESQIKVFDINGQVVWSNYLMNGDFNKDISTGNWPAGVYFVSLISGNGTASSKKLVIVK